MGDGDEGTGSIQLDPSEGTGSSFRLIDVESPFSRQRMDETQIPAAFRSFEINGSTSSLKPSKSPGFRIIDGRVNDGRPRRKLCS